MFRLSISQSVTLLITQTVSQSVCRRFKLAVNLSFSQSISLSVYTNSITFSFSLCPTPNRCSSSMISNPRLVKLTVGWSSACVPTTTCTIGGRGGEREGAGYQAF
jgi:hypothetical protein